MGDEGMVIGNPSSTVPPFEEGGQNQEGQDQEGQYEEGQLDQGTKKVYPVIEEDPPAYEAIAVDQRPGESGCGCRCSGSGGGGGCGCSCGPPAVPAGNEGSPAEKESKAGDSERGEGKATMKKNITMLHGICIIVGTIIGAGIFVSPNKVSKRVGSPGMSIVVWTLGGAISTIGAITFLELGTMYPKNGGQMVYLHRAFGSLLAFLSCWLLHVLLGGLRRSIGFLTFSKYFWAVFYEEASDVPEWGNQLVACVVCWLIFMVLIFKPDLTLKIIDVVTFFKISALGFVICLGAYYLITGHTENISVGFNNTNTEPQQWGEAWNSVLWAYNGWISLSVLLGEVKDPRMLPKIVGISMSIVTVLYVSAVTAYHIVLDIDTMNSESALASKMASKIIGPTGDVIFAVAVAVSTLGNAMCASLASSRFLQAGGAQGILPGCFALVNKRFKTPMFALLFVMCTATLFNLFGNVYSLINTASFTSFAFTSLCAVGLIVLRKKEPDTPRPAKVPLFFPVVTVITGIYLFVVPWITNTVMCGVWTGLTALGIPIFYVGVKGYLRPAMLVTISEKFTAFMGRILNSE